MSIGPFFTIAFQYGRGIIDNRNQGIGYVSGTSSQITGHVSERQG